MQNYLLYLHLSNELKDFHPSQEFHKALYLKSIRLCNFYLQEDYQNVQLPTAQE